MMHDSLWVGMMRTVDRCTYGPLYRVYTPGEVIIVLGICNDDVRILRASGQVEYERYRDVYAFTSLV